MSQQEHVLPAHPEKPSIRNQVRVLHRQYGIFRRELADAVGLNHRTVGHIELQHYEPSLGLAYVIADYFGLEPYEVFYRSHEGSETTPRYEPEPPETVQELAGGRMRARILVTLLAHGPSEKKVLQRRTRLELAELEEYLQEFKSAGFVQTEENQVAIFRKDENVLFCLTARSRSGLAKAFSESLRKS